MSRSEFTIILVLVTMLSIGAVVVIGAARDAATPCEAPAAGWEPPDLSRCPEDMALWDCIRHASYRSDI